MAERLHFVVPDTCNSASCLSSAVIGFTHINDYRESAYRVFLKGGGHIDVRAGQYEYEKLSDALEENAMKSD